MSAKVLIMTADSISHLSDRLRSDISWQAYALDWALSLSVRPVLELTSVGPRTMWFASQAYRYGGVYAKRLPEFVQVEKVRLGNFSGEWLRAGVGLQDRKVTLYLHGGGYFFSSAQHHRPITWRLSRATKRPVFSINYRMAPKHGFEQWRDDAVEAYQYLLKKGYQPEDIIVAGDSAGGHLTLVMLQTLRDRGLPQPAAAICISPWTDLSNTAESHHSNRWRDPMFASRAIRRLARFYADGRDATDPLISPLYGNFEGLPPLLIMCGSTEVLRDDARRVADKARKAGVNVVYEEWHRMPHVFPLFASILPEAKRAYQHVSHFLKDVETRLTH